MGVTHAAVFAQRQTLAGGLEFLHADFFSFAGFQALGRSFVRSGHAAVAFDVFLRFLVGMLGQGSAGQKHGSQEQKGFFHRDHLKLRSWETSTR